jgi:2-polyprenyl-3-methyl-5-hydroxy-6-metoxy-1,4-benzoquinol methylase
VEAKLFDGETPFVSTFDFHKDRERAPHWEQPAHRGRLERAVQFVHAAASEIWLADGDNDALPVTVVDLGCGDGGLLQQLKQWPTLIDAYGYDFQPSNALGWKERGVTAVRLDFVANWTAVTLAQVYVITECLEHLADPHKMVQRIHNRGAHIIASSPWTEHAGSHDECHAWAWDVDGYAKMLTDAGFMISGVEQVGMFQVMWGRP